ncbi:hypothetical protein J2W92_000730 [Rhizobium leguminosarum]
MVEGVWWYIDALDTTAGSAFASYRNADLMDVEELSEPAYYLQAPFFRPEPVASRALAFAATRAEHQLGLFDAKQEVAFASLEDLTEFVRRAYVASGGGDGAGGGGGGPTPPNPPDDEDGPSPELPDLGSSEQIQRMLGFSVRIQNSDDGRRSIEREGPTQAWPIANFQPYGPEQLEARDGYRALSVAAGVLLLEFFRRFPRGPDRLRDWEEGYWRLNSFLSYFDFYGEFSDAFSDPVNKTIAQHGPLQRWLKDHPYEERRWWSHEYRWLAYAPQRNLDVLDSLSLWPVPESIAQKRDVSVRDYLATYLASPGTLKNTHGAAIILFASACIASQGIAIPWGAYSASEPYARLSTAGLRWLVRQLPSTIFEDRLEKLIEDARELRVAEFKETVDAS